ncbi:MAG: hypothetical protein RSC66_09990 [Comamonas sp.]
MTQTAPIAHTAFALLAWRTFGIYAAEPWVQHDYFWDPVSLGLASLVVLLHTLRWWQQGPQAAVEAPAFAESVAASLVQLKKAMFASFWYLGYLFPSRKIAGILVENHPRRLRGFSDYFSLYRAILGIRHFVLAHGLAALMAAYALGEGETFTQGVVVSAIGPSWMLLCWSIWMYSACWLLLGAGLLLRPGATQLR